MWGMERIILRSFDAECPPASSHPSNGSMNSLIFMMFLMFGTLEVILFKTMIALDLTDNGSIFSF